MKKFGLRKLHLFFSSLLIFLVHLPFVFAKNKPYSGAVPVRARVHSVYNDSLFSRITVTVENSVGSLYDSLRLNIMGLSRQAFDYAMKGFHTLDDAGKINNDRIISIADFSQPSSKKRLFVIDLDNNKVLFNTYVAHGVNSGREYARQFSNTPESNQSSPGFYETLGTYNGSNGYSLKLEGLEKGINDNASSRAIVIHGAAYVSEGLIRSQGFIGRSWGCPALPEKLHKPIIDKIKNGTCLFIYSPQSNYLSRSSILNQ